ITGRAGTIQSVQDNGDTHSRDLIFGKMFKKQGDITARPATNHDRIGVVITGGKNREQAIDNAEQEVEKKKIIIQKTASATEQQNA
ncbi:MAG TPA: hypothetical protein PK253_06525, partial [Spirochaetota bacterium]|nr:hypothetical protein [Spirochaetota bacterium]